MLQDCYFAAKDGGRHVVHWSGTTNNQRHVFPHKSSQHKRAPIMRGDMEPTDDGAEADLDLDLDLDSETKLDIGDTDIHPLSQAAYWYRHPGQRGSNNASFALTGSGLTSKPENG